MLRNLCIAAAVVFAMSPGLFANVIDIDWVEVGNAGNAADSRTARGAVSYNYVISKHEVTNSQYAAYLNAVDPRGLNGWSLLTGGMSITAVSGNPEGSKFVVNTGSENKPVMSVSYTLAARFVNWLSKGQPTTPLEPIGTYGTRVGEIVNSGSYTNATGFISRNEGAVYVLPNRDEWYKAAYYSENKSGGTPGYWNFPTSNDGAPGTSSTVPTAVANKANYANTPGSITDVGSYTASASSWGAYDMAGNVYEWVEYKVSGTGSDDQIQIGGGAFSTSASGAWSRLSYQNFDGTSDATSLWSTANNTIGFRVVLIPEPSCVLLCVAGAGLFIRRRK